MPAWGAIHRRELVAGLRRLGFRGPFAGGKHEFMLRADLVLTIPNPHGKDIGITLLKIVLRQAGVSRKQWENA